jgi:hypothetical protein
MDTPVPCDMRAEEMREQVNTLKPRSERGIDEGQGPEELPGPPTIGNATGIKSIQGN